MPLTDHFFKSSLISAKIFSISIFKIANHPNVRYFKHYKSTLTWSQGEYVFFIIFLHFYIFLIKIVLKDQYRGFSNSGLPNGEL